MRRVHAIAGPFLLILLVLSLASVMAQQGFFVAAGDGLKPGEYVWTPELVPDGPVVVIVSLPAQRAHVYRNGVRIGISSVSTGKPDHETPAGVYAILQKRREHYSNLYDNAPMPFMQRLSWDGLALHAGSLPGYPASHGCIRLPAEFAEQLFDVTTPGTVVVVAEGGTFPPSVVSPGLFSPVDATTGTTYGERPSTAGEWAPHRSSTGPLTLVLSTADRKLVVMRNAVEIGRVDVAIQAPPAIGTRAYVVLEGTDGRPSRVVPDRPALRWLSVYTSVNAASDDLVREAIASGDIAIPPQFARLVYGELRPGSTLIITDAPLRTSPAPPQIIMAGDQPHSGS